MEEKDPVAMPEVEAVDKRLSDAERRVKRLEIRVDILERGADDDPVRS